MHIGEAMRVKGISLEAVSALLGVHRNTVANKLSGETQFTMLEGFKLKTSLFPEYDLEYLFGPDDKAS